MSTHIIIFEYLCGSVVLGKGASSSGTHLVGEPDILHELGSRLIESNTIKSYQLARLENIHNGG